MLLDLMVLTKLLYSPYKKNYPHYLSMPSSSVSIATGGLYTISKKRELAAHIPQADGHDGFLLEFELINRDSWVSQEGLS